MGRALRAATAVDRDELFLTTKMWRKYHGYEATRKNLETSLKRLQTDYVDLWLIHWPGPAYSTMNRRKDLIEEHGIEYYFKVRIKLQFCLFFQGGLNRINTSSMI